MKRFIKVDRPEGEVFISVDVITAIIFHSMYAELRTTHEKWNGPSGRDFIVKDEKSLSILREMCGEAS